MSSAHETFDWDDEEVDIELPVEVDTDWCDEFREDHAGQRAVVRASQALIETAPGSRSFRSTDLAKVTGAIACYTEGEIVGAMLVPVKPKTKEDKELAAEGTLVYAYHLMMRAVKNTGRPLTWDRDQQVWVSFHEENEIAIFDDEE